MKTNKPRKPHALARHICALASACLIAASLAPAAAFASEATSRLYDSLYIPEGLDIGSMAPPNSGAATPAYTELPDDSTLFSGAPLPEKFDLRNSDGANFVTPVRSQNPWGTCWSFGAVAALESNLLMQAGGATGSDALATFDLSERFLSYFRYAPASDEALSAFGAASQTGEGLKVVDESSLFDAGGNLFDAVSFTMSAGGLPGEAAAPYRNASGETISWEDPVAGTISCYAPDGTWSLPETVLTDRNNRTADFDSCMMLPTPWNLVYLDDGSMVAGEFDPQAIDVAKRAIMENGAIAAGYYADVAIPEDQTQETEFFSVKNWCQYVNRPTAGNHVVTIVGWDDTYPKGNFPTEPEGDGAWIVKNSWGSKDGDAGSLSHWGIDGTGYFYLSYYDMSVASLYSVTAADADPDTIIQQHDWVGVTESFLVSPMSTTEASAANVFTAEQDMLIESVTAFADASETNARIAIYLLGDEAETPDDGVLVAEQTTLLPFRGLYTVDLDEPVPVRAGQRYAVVQTLTATMEDPQTGEQIPVWCLPIERGVSQDYSASIGYSLYMDVVVNEGESLCFADGGWFDASEFNDDPNMTEDGMVTYGNFAIKVFGTPTQLQDVGSLSIVHTNDIHGRYATAGADAAVNGFAAVAALAQDCGADLILDAGVPRQHLLDREPGRSGGRAHGCRRL